MKIHQQGNEIIVTELRPMSDLVPPGERILIKRKYWHTLSEGYTDIYGNIWIVEMTIPLKNNDFEGWLPMPIYQPEKIIT